MATKTNSNLVKILRPGSEVRRRIQVAFVDLLMTRNQGESQRLFVTCCYEDQPVSKITQVVPQESAVIPGFTAIGIDTDHREMARFSRLDDPGFVVVSGELERWTDAIRLTKAGVEASDAVQTATAVREPLIALSNSMGTVTVHGDITKSIVVGGSQTIRGDVTF
ncbi:hypothetical protein MKZ38_003552 [Zalerion maritima]|uniref:Uncharacterized protein n=1 Tax=Zalerion maritima TaxID=339359 RepID=A0AAD5WQL7_9PEZI|nr:hypothetical protein MKZ38_003552 [Zalerion maritima]